MRRVWLGPLVLGVAGLVACGGRAIDDPGSGSSEPSSPAPADTTTEKTEKTDKSNPSEPLPSHELGTCIPGFSRAENPSRPCRLLTESGVCFDNSDVACACICPRDRDSVCVFDSDPGPPRASLIYCL